MHASANADAFAMYKPALRECQLHVLERFRTSTYTIFLELANASLGNTALDVACMYAGLPIEQKAKKAPHNMQHNKFMAITNKTTNARIA